MRGLEALSASLASPRIQIVQIDARRARTCAVHPALERLQQSQRELAHVPCTSRSTDCGSSQRELTRVPCTSRSSDYGSQCIRSAFVVLNRSPHGP